MWRCWRELTPWCLRRQSADRETGLSSPIGPFSRFKTIKTGILPTLLLSGPVVVLLVWRLQRGQDQATNRCLSGSVGAVLVTHPDAPFTAKSRVRGEVPNHSFPTSPVLTLCKRARIDLGDQGRNALEENRGKGQLSYLCPTRGHCIASSKRLGRLAPTVCGA